MEYGAGIYLSLSIHLLFNFQFHRVLASKEELSTDEGSSSDEESDMDELGKNLESMLANKKTAVQVHCWLCSLHWVLCVDSFIFCLRYIHSFPYHDQETKNKAVNQGVRGSEEKIYMYSLYCTLTPQLKCFVCGLLLGMV